MKDRFIKVGTTHHPYSSEVIMSDELQKEWSEMSPAVKRTVKRIMKENFDELDLKNQVKVLCCVLTELLERMEKLEEK